MASVAKLRRRTFQEVDCRRGVEKKSHSRGLERDGLGHQISGAMTSLVIVWFPPYGTQKPRRSPPCPGLFLNRPTSWPSGRTWLRPSLVGAIAVAQGGLASGLSAGWPPGPDRETLSIAELTDHHRLRSHAEREMRRCHGPSEREHAHHQATARCHTGPADSSDTHRMS